MDLFLKALLLNCVHENPHLPKSNQSTALSTLGWGWWGDTWQNLLPSCLRGTQEPTKVSCPLAQPSGPCPWLRGQPLPSADETWKCQIQTKQPQICGVLSRAGYQGFWTWLFVGVCLEMLVLASYLSHPGTVLWCLAFIPLCLILFHLELVKTIPCKQFIQEMYYSWHFFTQLSRKRLQFLMIFFFHSVNTFCDCI